MKKKERLEKESERGRERRIRLREKENLGKKIERKGGASEKSEREEERCALHYST